MLSLTLWGIVGVKEVTSSRKGDSQGFGLQAAHRWRPLLRSLVAGTSKCSHGRGQTSAQRELRARPAFPTGSWNGRCCELKRS